MTFFKRRQVEIVIVIGLGGFLGANARYLVSVWAAGRFGSAFPWGTMIINVTGSCLLGLFLGWSANHVALDPRLRLLVAVGFFGSYTTFSTFSNESMALLQTGNWLGAAANVLVTNFICLLSAGLGLALGSRL